MYDYELGIVIMFYCSVLKTHFQRIWCSQSQTQVEILKNSTPITDCINTNIAILIPPEAKKLCLFTAFSVFTTENHAFLKGFACKNLKKFPPPVRKTIGQNTLLGPNFHICIPDLRADERAGDAEHTK